MTRLDVDLVIAEGAWGKHIDQDRLFVHGYMERIGVLPEGMQSGAPSVAVMGRGEHGETVIIEVSYRNMFMAMAAIIGRWGKPK